MTTAPKSILQARSGDGSGTLTSEQDVRQHIREFLNKYKRLPDDFLRVPASYYQLQLQPHQMDLGTLQRGNPLMANQGGTLIDMIDISVVEAQLVKNYGLLRMDLYCKIRVGHMVCETSTSTNCAKNPKWDGVYQFALKPGINSFHLEIYDEKQFSLDEKIAWLHEPIPQEIFQGITVERWFPLSGRLGKDKEGSVLLVLSHKSKVLSRSMMPQLHQDFFMPPNQLNWGASVLPVDPNIQIPTYIQPPPTPTNTNVTNPPLPSAEQQPRQQPQQQQQQQLQQQQQATGAIRPASEEDVNQLAEMFPSIDKSIIKTILENNNHDKDAAISTLLAMA